MEDWVAEIILKNAQAALKEQNRKFMVAYGKVDEKYHGYITSIRKSVRIFGKPVSDNELKELAKKYDIPIYGNDKGVYVSIDIPYMSLDGCLAELNDSGRDKEIEIHFTVENISDYMVVRARVKVSNGTAEGFSKIEDDDIEKAASRALRKAIGFLGFGKLPTYSTKFGEDADMKKFREFLKKNG